MTPYYFSWQKRGRIFVSAGQYPWMMSHNQNPCALVLDDRIRIYFTCRPEPDQRGYFASVTSFVEIDQDDPNKVLRIHDRPILEPGSLGAFDQFGVMPGAVLRVGEEVWMYYVGWMRCEGAPYSHAIGLAISGDGGITFQRYAEGPLFGQTPTEPFLQNSPTVTILDGKFHMWYSSGIRWFMYEGRPESVYVLMHAVSDDGINWKREGVPCVASLTPDECQTNPSLLELDGIYHLWFCHRLGKDFRNKAGGYRIGYATSTDLIHWIRQDDASPLEPSAEGWDSEMVCYPYVFSRHDQLWMLYSGNHFGRDGFGLATCLRPFTDQTKSADNKAVLMAQASNWGDFYNNRFRASAGRYPTEWVVRTLAGGNYPGLKIDKTRYPSARILDMGCGDGRNLPVLIDLGFEVYASEICSTIVGGLEALAHELRWPVQFTVGLNTNLPYPNHYFDYMLCCASCYYLDGSVTWSEVRSELARVVKPGGILVANFPDEENFILANAIRQPDGSWLITNDPFGLRNGNRFMAAKNPLKLAALLSPQFRVMGIGHQNDDYYGIRVSGYFVVAQRL